MSVEAMLAVQKLTARTSHACFRVLMTLAEHANSEGGNSWPSIDTIAAEAQTDEKTVRRSLTKLQEDALIVGQKGRGRGNVAVWALNFPVPPLKKEGMTPGYTVPETVKEGLTPRIQDGKEGVVPGIVQGKEGVVPGFDLIKEGVETVKEGLTPPEPEERKKESSLRSLSRSPAVRCEGEFEAWWQAYPRKVGKDGARKAYTAAVKRGAMPLALLEGLRRQRWNDDPRYVPHPATWLNQGRWQDDPAAAAPVEPNLPRAGPVQPRRPATNGAVELLLRARERRNAERDQQPALEGVTYAVR